MNAHFETNGIYPLAAAPRWGYGKPNPTGEYILVDQRAPSKAVQLDDDAPDGFKLVEGYADASTFDGPNEASIAGGDIINRVKSRAQSGNGVEQHKAAA